MHIDRSNLDIVSMVFFIVGAFIVISQPQTANVGWVLIIIGIVKQLMEWK